MHGSSRIGSALCALVVIAAAAAPGASTQRISHAAQAASEDRSLIAFDREADLAAPIATSLAAKDKPFDRRKCSFSSGRNPVKPRKNECRLV